jgi:hypothetical protein
MTDQEINSTILKIFSDSPIDEAKYFNFDSYANAICDIIQQPDNKTPLSIAINGKWGSGKSSLMKTIQKKIENPSNNPSRRKVKTVWFNAWKYSQTDSLLASLIREIFDEMGRQNFLTRKGFFPKLNYYILKIHGKVDTIQQLSDLASLLTLGLGPDLKKWQKEPVYEKHLPFYDNFKKYIDLVLQFFVVKNVDGHYDDSKGVLVIFIDDLDRCSPQSVATILESINLFFDQDGCIFVFGLDANIISKAIRSHYEKYDGFSGENYIKKLIQLQFNLPEICVEDCKEFIEKELIAEEPLKKYTDLIIIGSANNPRQIKQFVNSIKFTLSLKNLIVGNQQIDEELLIKWSNLNSISDQFILSVKNHNVLLFILQSFSRRDLSQEDSLWYIEIYEKQFLNNILESRRSEIKMEFELYSSDEKIIKTLKYGKSVFHEDTLNAYISLSNLSPQEPKVGEISERYLRIEADKDSFVIGYPIRFMGNSSNCGKVVHLTAYGPEKYTTGIKIGSPEVNYRGEWKFTWSPDLSLPSGNYTIEVTDSDNSVSDEVDVKAEKGSISLMLAGSQTYYIGEKLKFSGVSTSAKEVFLAIIGPLKTDNIGIGGLRKFDNPQIISIQDDPNTFVKVKKKIDNTFSFNWDTSTIGQFFNEGTYTAYAIEKPSTLENLAGIVYGSVSFIIRKPFVSVTATQSTYAQGDPIIISGTAEGVQNQKLQIWVISDIGIHQEIISASRDRSFKFEVSQQLINQFKTGQYFVIIQHPMVNNEFDIYLDESKQDILSNFPKKGTQILSMIDGPFGIVGATRLTDAIGNKSIDDTYTKLQLSVESPFIHFNDIPDIMKGEKFSITAVTNLRVSDEISIEIRTSSHTARIQSSTSNVTGASGTVKVLKGDSGYNKISFDLDTTNFIPQEYDVNASGVSIKVTGSIKMKIIEK